MTVRGLAVRSIDPKSHTQDFPRRVRLCCVRFSNGRNGLRSAHARVFRIQSIGRPPKPTQLRPSTPKSTQQVIGRTEESTQSSAMPAATARGYVL